MHCSSLLDHLVGGRQQRFRDGKAERFGGLEADYEIELGRLLDWQEEQPLGPEVGGPANARPGEGGGTGPWNPIAAAGSVRVPPFIALLSLCQTLR